MAQGLFGLYSMRSNLCAIIFCCYGARFFKNCVWCSVYAGFPLRHNLFCYGARYGARLFVEQGDISVDVPQITVSVSLTYREPTQENKNPAAVVADGVHGCRMECSDDV